MKKNKKQISMIYCYDNIDYKKKEEKDNVVKDSLVLVEFVQVLSLR